MGHSHDHHSKAKGFSYAEASVLAVMVVCFGIMLELLSKSLDVYATLSISRLEAWMSVVFALLFIALWGLLDATLFGPHLKLLEAREEATTGAVREAHEKSTQADVIIKEYEEKIIETRVQAVQRKLSALNAVKQQADDIVTKAEEHARGLVSKARTELESRTASLRSGAERDIDSMAQMIVQKLKQPQKDVGRVIN